MLGDKRQTRRTNGEASSGGSESEAQERPALGSGCAANVAVRDALLSALVHQPPAQEPGSAVWRMEMDAKLEAASPQLVQSRGSSLARMDLQEEWQQPRLCMALQPPPPWEEEEDDPRPSFSAPSWSSVRELAAESSLAKQQ